MSSASSSPVSRKNAGPSASGLPATRRSSRVQSFSNSTGSSSNPLGSSPRRTSSRTQSSPFQTVHNNSPASPEHRTSSRTQSSPTQTVHNNSPASPERRRSNRLSSQSRNEEAQDNPVVDNAAAPAPVGDGDGSGDSSDSSDDDEPAGPAGGNSGPAQPRPPLAELFTPVSLGEILNTRRRVVGGSGKGKKASKKADKNKDKKNDKTNKTKAKAKAKGKGKGKGKGKAAEGDGDGQDGEDDVEEELEAGLDNEADDQAENGEPGGEDEGEETYVIDPLPPFDDQPPARASHGNTNPPLYEDRGFTFRPVGRHYRFGPNKVVDQQAHLFLKLVDMRKGPDGQPKRQLILWTNQNGVPRDWNDTYTIKKLNASHVDNIRTICHDHVWLEAEAHFIAERFGDNPDMSMKELAYRFNNHFMGRPRPWRHPRPNDEIHPGRTTESIRAEFLTHESLYLLGNAPAQKKELRNKRWLREDGLTEGDIQNGMAAVPNAGNAAGGGGSGAIKRRRKHKHYREDGTPIIKRKSDYRNLTIPDFKKLNLALTKGKKTRAAMQQAFEDQHDSVNDVPESEDEAGTPGDDSGPEAQPDGGNNGNNGSNGNGGNNAPTGNNAQGDGGADNGNDGDDDGGITVPRYTRGEKMGQPNYNSMSKANLEALATHRGVTFGAAYGPGGLRKLKLDYVRILDRDDKSVGRYGITDEDEDSGDEDPGPSKKSTKKPSKKPTKKRPHADSDVDGDGDAEGDGDPGPSSKKPKKKQKVTNVEEEAEEENIEEEAEEENVEKEVEEENNGEDSMDVDSGQEGEQDDADVETDDAGDDDSSDESDVSEEP